MSNAPPERRLTSSAFRTTTLRAGETAKGAVVVDALKREISLSSRQVDISRSALARMTSMPIPIAVVSTRMRGSTTSTA